MEDYAGDEGRAYRREDGAVVVVCNYYDHRAIYKEYEGQYMQALLEEGLYATYCKYEGTIIIEGRGLTDVRGLS